jgi:hypothetical protein
MLQDVVQSGMKRTLVKWEASGRISMYVLLTYMVRANEKKRPRAKCRQPDAKFSTSNPFWSMKFPVWSASILYQGNEFCGGMNTVACKIGFALFVWKNCEHRPPHPILVLTL